MRDTMNRQPDTTIDVREVVEIEIQAVGVGHVRIAIAILRLSAWACRRLGVHVAYVDSSGAQP